ncbi:MAG TPA: hypothetical protein VGL48_08405 [Acidimicrobiales bacterium]
MPAAAPVTQKANQILNGSDPMAQEAAHEAVIGAHSVREAVERVGLLVGMEDPIVGEALAVLEGLPRAIDAALLAALKSSLERRIPVSLEWEEGEVMGLRMKEVGDGAGRVDIVVITPHGRHFVRS